VTRLAVVPGVLRATGGHQPGRPEPGAGQWPLQSFLELGSLPTAVPCARVHARLVTAEWGLRDLAETTELMVSELVTNGVKASADLTEARYEGRRVPGRPPVRLWLCSDQRRVLIEVWDGSEAMPQERRPDPEEAGGRGLLLVEALAQDWGTYGSDDSDGKIVWALCAA
jgi:anti-sigma regulatory factor (Ser/Thr protein kinase)